VASVVMSIISAVIASFLLFSSAPVEYHYSYNNNSSNHLVMVVLGVIMLVLPIISASITCRHISYNPATELGVLQIIGGVIIFFLGVFGGLAGDSNMVFLVLGPFTAIFFFVSGGLAIGGAQSGIRSLQVASMVMSYISAVIVSFPFLHFFSSVIRSECAPYGCNALFLPLIILAVMLVLSITSASISSSYHLKICCCSPLNCRSGKHGGSDTQPNPVNQAHDQVDTINMEPATSDQMTAVNLLTAQNVDAEPATLVQPNPDKALAPLAPTAYPDLRGAGAPLAPTAYPDLQGAGGQY